MSNPDSFLRKLRGGAFLQVVAFGSSNTERRLAGMHWFDCFELACRTSVSRDLRCVNSGRGGDTTRQLLARLERDCLSLRPDLVFLTVGGNDSNPSLAISATEYRENLREMVRRLREAGSAVLLQTYYAFDLDRMDADFAGRFMERMRIVRETAEAEACPLLDHLSRWERLRSACPGVYAGLMADPCHVNAAGNLLLGAEVVRSFGLELPDDPLFREARGLQALLDRLEGGVKESGGPDQ